MPISRSTALRGRLVGRVVGVLALAAAVPAAVVGAVATQTGHAAAIAGGAGLAIGLAIALGAIAVGRLLRPLGALEDRAGRAERAELEASLARGDRAAAIGALSARLGHELSLPLTALRGRARQLAAGAADAPADRAALDGLAEDAARMQALVDGLLAYGRAPAERAVVTGEPVPARCSVAEVVRHAAAVVGPLAAHAGASLEVDVPAGAPAVAIDAQVLRGAIVQLIQRALHAMTTSGSTGAIAITARQAPGGVATIIGVSDPGPALSLADRARMFDPFAGPLSSPDSPELRVGLAICKHRIATAGGTIEAVDRTNGAELQLTIPNAG